LIKLRRKITTCEINDNFIPNKLMNKVCLLTGSNEDDRIRNLQKAKDFIGERIGTVSRESDIYETEPWGYKSEKYYLNQCLLIETNLSPEKMMEVILDIENTMGRRREKRKYRDRKIDIDILFYNDEKIRFRDITIPHPRLHERRFVLVPLSEIVPQYIHPVLGKTIENLLSECTDSLSVRVWKPASY
jgi:2-amino-4-hydroxy-6-hydroxymethyldihydropteridine diphosphokinase